MEYRWAGIQPDRLSELAADLVRLQVNVIVAAGLLPAFAAKAATTSIPIVFSVAADPVQLGLVASLNRPGGNLTGFNSFQGEIGAKGLALLRELVPSTVTVGFVENPNNPVVELMTRDVLAAAAVAGLKVQILKASTDREIDAAFLSLVQARTGALLVGNDVLFNSRVEQLVALAARYAIPTMYPLNEAVVAGGLISYGSSLIESYRHPKRTFRRLDAETFRRLCMSFDAWVVGFGSVMVVTILIDAYSLYFFFAVQRPASNAIAGIAGATDTRRPAA
jgi:putative ABC transport system substrate-binding protein